MNNIKHIRADLHYPPDTRPLLEITREGGGKLGNCYYGMVFLVKSDKPLSEEALVALRDLGFLGYGQEFYTKTLPEEVVTSTPVWLAEDGTQYPCPLPAHVKNVGPYAHREIRHQESARYVYRCESRVDSSD
jgi:hypothetical protein